MRLKLDLHHADEFAAAAAFCTALAEHRRKRQERVSPPIGMTEGLNRVLYGDAGDSGWRGTVPPTLEEQMAKAKAEVAAETDVTAGEIVDALHGALTAEPAPEPVKKRPGRPRKVETEAAREAEADAMAETPATVEEVNAQIDLEDVIAATNAVSQDNAPPAPEAPQPADPAAGWTEHDARNAGRALLQRAPSPEVGTKRLHELLVPYGVQQVRALKADQIESFVVATLKEVF